MAAELRVLRTKTKPLGRKPGPGRDQPAKVHPLPHVLMAEIDHALIEGIMATMGDQARKDFWQAHVEVLGKALVDRGMAEEVVRAILADHFQKVRALHASRRKKEKAAARYAVSFDEPPAIGTELMIQGKRAVVVAVEQYVRKKDGLQSWLVHWDVEGQKATSGLRSASILWKQEGGDDA